MNQEAFLALVRAGLWEKDVELRKYGTADFDEIKRLAEEQSVVGLVAAGLEHVVDAKVPKEFVLQFIGLALQIEQRNKDMNAFAARLLDKLHKEDIYAILVKGQGVAQCYEKPLWRTSGDIDLLLDQKDYDKAKQFLLPIASSVGQEAKSIMHLGLVIDSWDLELHGSLRSVFLPQMDNVVETILKKDLLSNNVRIWNNNSVDVFLPEINSDCIIVFTHIIKHFFHGGIGLRQLCDWCRLLWYYKEEVDILLLENRLGEMGLLTEWKAFASLAVDYLGMPNDAMPLYVPEKRWKQKASRILSFILDTGNFGHNRDMTYYSTRPFIVRKTISLWRHTSDSFRRLYIFPKDSTLVWLRLFNKGIIAVLNRNGHD